MQKVEFVARTDLEIGDKVNLKGMTDVCEVYDIKAIHSLREKTVIFEFAVITKDGHTQYGFRRDELIYPTKGMYKNPRPTRYEQAMDIAQGYGYTADDAKRVAKHIFAKMVVDGATIGRVNGKLVVHKERLKPKLP